MAVVLRIKAIFFGCFSVFLLCSSAEVLFVVDNKELHKLWVEVIEDGSWSYVRVP